MNARRMDLQQARQITTLLTALESLTELRDSCGEDAYEFLQLCATDGDGSMDGVTNIPKLLASFILERAEEVIREELGKLEIEPE